MYRIAPALRGLRAALFAANVPREDGFYDLTVPRHTTLALTGIPAVALRAGLVEIGRLEGFRLWELVDGLDNVPKTVDTSRMTNCEEHGGMCAGYGHEDRFARRMTHPSQERSTRTVTSDAALDRVLDELREEVGKARAKHAPMHSPHEGHSVIREEAKEQA